MRTGGLLLLVLALAACGQTGEESDRADTSLTIRDSDGAPLAGLTVVFHDADGSVADVVQTDSNGNVTGSISPNARATVIVDESAGQLVTFGVQQNGTLVFQVPSFPTINNVGTVDVTYSAAPPGANAPEYDIDIGCDAVTTSNLFTPSLTIDETCLTVGNTFHVIGQAYDSVTGALVGSNEQVENDAPTGGGSTAVTLGPWTTDFDTLDVTFSNLPTEATAAGIRDVSLLMDGIFYGTRIADEAATDTTGGYNFSTDVMNGMQAAVVSGFVKYDDIIGESKGETATRRYILDAVPTSISIDAAAELPPALASYQLIDGDPDRPVIVMGTADVFTGDVAVAHVKDPHIDWIIIESISLGSSQNANELRIETPALPDALGSLRPATGATMPVYVIDFDDVDGYSEFVAEYGLGPLAMPKVDPVLWLDRVPADPAALSIVRTVTYAGLE